MSLNLHFSTAEGISLLFYPHVEVIVHNLKTGLIAAIYNNFSKRKVGDESLLDQIDEFPDVFPVYVKTNWDGKKIKSISSTLRDSKGKAIGLMCMNLDISKWEELGHFLGSWLSSSTEPKPSALFNDDWREKINTYVFTYLTTEGTTLKMLSKEKKKALVLELYSEGAFKAKNAASYISDVLDLSRASVYNYLKGHTHD
jgi:predicted transcriptional regulator YheO